MSVTTYPLPRLRAGDVILFAQQPCRVVRVSDCNAVVAIPRPPREFVTLGGKQVRLQPKPALVRISSDSGCPILSHLVTSTHQERNLA